MDQSPGGTALMRSPGGTIRRGISRIILDEDQFGGSIPLQKTWGRVEVVAFTANYMVGTGFLTLPHAIVQSGTLLGTLVLLFTTGLVVLSTGCILEALARAYPLIEHRNKMSWNGGTHYPGKIDNVRYGAVAEGEDGEEDEHNFIDNETVSSGKVTSIKKEQGNKSASLLVVGENRIELPDLIEIFLGPKGKAYFTFSTISYLVVSLWSYTVIVGQTFSVAMPLADDPDTITFKYSYWFYISVFGVLVTILATQDMNGKFMTWLNLAFSVGRVVTVLIMVTTLFIAIANSGGDDDLAFVPSAPAPLVDFSGVLTTMPICLFSLIYHHSIPTLSEPAIEKKELGSYFSNAVWLVVLAYMLISVPAVIYFGEDVQAAISLNWVTYDPDFNPYLAAFLRNMVIFFPAFSLISTYPLMCITLSNNALSFGVPISETPLRILSSVLPLLIGAVATDLSSAAALAGLFGFLISLIFPVLLQRSSFAAFESQFGKGSADTEYSTALTKSPLAVASLGVVGVVLLVASSVQLVYTFAKPFWFTVDEDQPDNWG